MEFSFKLENENGLIKYKLNRSLEPQEVMNLVTSAIIMLNPELDPGRAAERHERQYGSGGSAYQEEEEEEEEREEEEESLEEVNFSSKVPEGDRIVLKALAFDRDNRMKMIKVMREITGNSLTFCRDVVDNNARMQAISREKAIQLYTAWRKLGVMVIAHTEEEAEKLHLQRTTTESLHDSVVEEGPPDE